MSGRLYFKINTFWEGRRWAAHTPSMALSLGEKLRMAREERGISIGEVAEQTRISALYLQAIDQNDFKALPGGIFNKGFVRSYAKYVGVDEQEALQEYSRLMAENSDVEDPGARSYRPEVLTDDRAATSIVPTIIFAAIILGLMSAGILFLVNFIRQERSEPSIAANAGNNQGHSSVNSAVVPAVPTGGDDAMPTMGKIRVEFKSVGSDIWLNADNDGTKSTPTVSADKPATFEPRERLTLSYSKSLAKAAQLTINGKPIALPEVPLNPKKGLIELDINTENLAVIWQNGRFEGRAETPASAPVDGEPQRPTAPVSGPSPTTASSTPEPKPSAVPSPKPSAANVNAAPAGPPTMTGRPLARPAASPKARPSVNSNNL